MPSVSKHLTTIGVGRISRRGCQSHQAIGLLALLAIAGCGRSPDGRPGILTSVRQVRQLSAEQARLGIAVRIQGILTYFDGRSTYCFVQDSTGGIRVKLASGQAPPAVGWRVQVAGIAAAGGAAPTMIEARIVALGASMLPPPISVSPERSRDPAYEYKRVTVAGVVKSLSSERPGLVTLEIGSGSRTVWATVPASNAVIDDQWIDAEVRASGVLDEALDGSAAGADSRLWMDVPTSLEIVHPAAIRTLLAVVPAKLPQHRVRVRGVPYMPRLGGIGVLDEGGQIQVRMVQVDLDPNTRVLDVAGFLTWEQGHALLDHAVPILEPIVDEPDLAP